MGYRRLCVVTLPSNVATERVFHHGHRHGLKDLHRFSLNINCDCPGDGQGASCVSASVRSQNHSAMPIADLGDYCSNSSIHSHYPDLVPKCRHQFSQSSAVFFESQVDRFVAQKFDGQFDSNLGR